MLKWSTGRRLMKHAGLELNSCHFFVVILIITTHKSSSCLQIYAPLLTSWSIAIGWLWTWTRQVSSWSRELSFFFFTSQMYPSWMLYTESDRECSVWWLCQHLWYGIRILDQYNGEQVKMFRMQRMFSEWVIRWLTHQWLMHRQWLIWGYGRVFSTRNPLKHNW